MSEFLFSTLCGEKEGKKLSLEYCRKEGIASAAADLGSSPISAISLIKFS